MICSKCKKDKDTSLFYKRKTSKRGYQSHCKECIGAYSHQFYLSNIEKHKEISKKWRENNKLKIKEYIKKWKFINKERCLITRRKRREIKKESINLMERNRYKNNINHRLGKIIRGRFNLALKFKINYSALKYLGCSIDELKAHLESKFQPGMTWDNWSKNGWHIDHIVPLSSFDLTNPDELKKACHFSNLQPLWAKDNLSKGNKYGPT